METFINFKRNNLVNKINTFNMIFKQRYNTIINTFRKFGCLNTKRKKTSMVKKWEFFEGVPQGFP